MVDQLFRNSFVNDNVFNTMAARYDTCNSMDAGMTVANVASLSLLYNTLGIQPDQAPAADQLPTDIPYRVDVPPRETVTLKAPRAVLMPGKGANNPRTFGLCPKLSEARNGSSYVNQTSMLGKTGRQRDRELLILRIGWNSQSEYEWSEHVGLVGGGRKMGCQSIGSSWARTPEVGIRSRPVSCVSSMRCIVIPSCRIGRGTRCGSATTTV